MGNAITVEKITIEQVQEGGAVKAGGLYYNVSKFSAFKDFKVGQTYTVEVEHYEHQGFLKRRIKRLMPE